MLAILQTTGTVPCDKLREAIPATDRLNDPETGCSASVVMARGLYVLL